MITWEDTVRLRRASWAVAQYSHYEIRWATWQKFVAAVDQCLTTPLMPSDGSRTISTTEPGLSSRPEPGPR